MTEKFSLKDHLFNEAKVRYLAGLFETATPDFNKKKFVTAVMQKLLTLELKERIRHIAAVLDKQLPTDFEAAATVILQALPSPLDPTKRDDDFGDFIFAPLGEYVATQGCSKKYLKTSFRLLEALTMRFSMEDTIRVFIRAYPAETLAQCQVWTTHPHYHVRRLVSEGTRSLLPWSGRVPLTAEETLPFLTRLHADPTRFVTRSVANHLNDIAKTNPSLVVDTLGRWQKQQRQNAAELAWMTRHALRTLVKQGNKEALALLGYTTAKVKIETFLCTKATVKVGDALTLELTLKTAKDSDLLIDYLIHFVKKNGSTAPKVFKWKMCTVRAGKSETFTKRHQLKADATTFTLYPGEHKVELQINGLVVATTTFQLKH